MATSRFRLADRWLVTATWPLGVSLTAWDYMWRSTPMHRSESSKPLTGELGPGPPPPALRDDLVPADDGHGPLFHRSYRARIREAKLSDRELLEAVKSNMNRPAPTSFARFQKLRGEDGRMVTGDEYVVRMPGPWNGPVRVLATDSTSFRFGTLAGHMEAGQIEFRAVRAPGGELWFEIDSWARSSSKLVHLMYHKLRLAKEVQAHMWISFLEGTVKLSGGRMTGGIEMDTQRFEQAAGD
jgi:hypothetical protein